MSGGLPEFLDLAHVTRQPWERAGRIRIGSLPRLCATLADSAGEVELRLRARDEGGGQVVVQGEASAELALICQRCLQPMTRRVDACFRLAWVHNEREAAAVQSENCDPLLSLDGRVRLAELAEDELLLALPAVALHEVDHCAVELQPVVAHADGPAEPAKQNPFAVLGTLMQRR